MIKRTKIRNLRLYQIISKIKNKNNRQFIKIVSIKFRDNKFKKLTKNK